LLDLRFIEIMARKLLTGDIFGVAQYCTGFEEKAIGLADLKKLSRARSQQHGILYRFAIKTAQHYEKLSERTGELLVAEGAPTMVLQILEELLSNALVRAPRAAASGSETVALNAGDGDLSTAASIFATRSETDRDYELQFGVHNDELVLAVIDPHGSLQREDILYRLERQVRLGPDGLPKVIHDNHGRGLFISREHM